MSCDNCMKHRPDDVLFTGIKTFTCPECKQIWVTAGVGPGNYWETPEDQEKEKREIREFRARKNGVI